MTETMSQTLKELMVKHIQMHGPMDIGQYMSMALSHPEHGYYMKQDPFGRAKVQGGDFTTAPEVSQMYGEMLGAWAADMWMQMGSPSRFIFLECGPGRGTLMADMMRATKGVPGFEKAAEIRLLEISPTLKRMQAETLSAYTPFWNQSLESVPDNAPMIVIGNEFFDALPFRQLVKGPRKWNERVVAVDEDEALCFGSWDAGVLESAVPPAFEDAEEGAIFEVAPMRNQFTASLAGRIKAQGGAALFVDYGHAQAGLGDTFQALYKHAYTDVFEHIGDADLTSHVDFEALGAAASALGCDVTDVREQGAFLKALGIEARAATLKGVAPEKAKNIEKDLQRLVGVGQMGALFKVIGFSHYDSEKLRPAGF